MFYRPFLDKFWSELLCLTDLFWTSSSENFYVLQTFFGQVLVRIAMFYRHFLDKFKWELLCFTDLFEQVLLRIAMSYRPLWTSSSENCYIPHIFVDNSNEIISVDVNKTLYSAIGVSRKLPNEYERRLSEGFLHHEKKKKIT